nr:HAMP domain-containing sensor histidine kinase [Massilia sp. Dwa41.01b]
MVDAFNALLGRIEAGARAVDEFRANVAHQLRTPLAGLRLQLEWLAARHADDPETRRSVEMMLGANERMIRQTNQLLSLERAEPQRFARARLVPLDLAQVVADSVQTFVERAAVKEIDLGFELEPAPVRATSSCCATWSTTWSTTRCATRRGEGGSRSAAAGAPAGALLRVEDNGPGIAPHLRAQVFERFVRLDENTAGSGLAWPSCATSPGCTEAMSGSRMRPGRRGLHGQFSLSASPDSGVFSSGKTSLSAPCQHFLRVMQAC